jgi:hypothetical protein
MISYLKLESVDLIGSEPSGERAAFRSPARNSGQVIDRNAARLSRSRFFSAAILIVDSRILPAIKRTEALKIHKYLQLGYFLWVATDPSMILASKELHILLSRSLSGRLAQRSNNAVECKCTAKCRHHDVIQTRYVTLFCCVKVTS